VRFKDIAYLCRRN